MTDDTVWQPLRKELGRWKKAGRRARLWLRDDDAVEPTEMLDRLLGIAGAHSIPLTLAVIPAFTGEPLARRLAGKDRLSVAVHGWSHRNHAPAGEKKQELGAHRPAEAVIGELREGHARLRGLYPGQFLAMLVPPWNRIDTSLVPELAACGFAALSVYGPAKPSSPIALVNTHVDILDWHGTGGGRDHGELVAGLVRELERRFVDDGEPIGVLTHHLVHDQTAWRFIEALLAETAAHPAVEWVSAANVT